MHPSIIAAAIYTLPVQPDPQTTTSPLPPRRSLLYWLLLGGTGFIVAGAALLGIAVIFILPQLPSTAALTHYVPKQPMRIYSADGRLLRLFGDERRIVVSLGEFPNTLKLAILAAEDQRFYQHGGIDFLGLARALIRNLAAAGYSQGASTITMQLARNYFFSAERTIKRKLYEALMAIKLEHNLNKNQILEVYMNQIYLGNRSYGFGAAAETYFGKAPKDLTLAEAAMLAGLPQSPSRANPIRNIKRAKQRQKYVLHKMREAGYISEAQMIQAINDPITIKSFEESISAFHSEYVAEMVRLIVTELLPPESLEQGLSVITTIRAQDQTAAYTALRQGLSAFDQRHGYRGIEQYVELPASLNEETLALAMEDVQDYDGYVAALVLSVSDKKVQVTRTDGTILTLDDKQSQNYLSPAIQQRLPENKRIRRGAIIRIAKAEDMQWHIVQMPEVEGAFISSDPRTGEIRSLVGGSDFARSKFNRVYQALRQPGSSFKPFIYSAALEKGYMPGTLLPDEPITLPAAESGGEAWTPKNYDGTFDGPITMRTALKKSRNLATIHLLEAIGVGYAQDYAQRFGFTKKNLPPYLTLALGTGGTTPWDMLEAYSTFANGGYHVQPYLIQAIYNAKGQLIAKTTPATADDESNRVLDARNAYLMNSMLQDVVRSGTGAKASQLGRRDIAGKTGTTNDYMDAWFAGYQNSVAAVCWVGYDQPRRLGNAETGGAVALPIWMNYMREALRNIPVTQMARPEGLQAKEILLPGGAKGEDLVYDEFIDSPKFYADEQLEQKPIEVPQDTHNTDNEATPAATDDAPPPSSP